MRIDDLSTLTTLKVDTGADLVFNQALVEGVDFRLYPLNQTPKESVKLLPLRPR